MTSTENKGISPPSEPPQFHPSPRIGEEEDWARHLFEHASTGLVLLTIDGLIARANRAFESILGRSIGELEVTHEWVHTHPEDRPATEDLIRQLLAGPNSSLVLKKRYLHRDGRPVPIHATFTLIRDAQGNPRHLMAEVRRAPLPIDTKSPTPMTRSLFSKAQPAGLVGTFRIEFGTQRWHSSKVLSGLMGIDCSHPKGLEEWLEIIHSEDRPRISQHLESDVFGQRKPFNEEYRIVRRSDQQTRWVHAQGEVMLDDANRPVALVGTVRDVSARRGPEIALGADQDQHRAFIETAMDGYWLVSSSGHLLEVNDAYCQMSGYSVQELLTLNVSDLEANENPETTAVHLAQISSQGEGRFESRHRRKNGQTYDVEVCAQYHPVDGGRFVAFVRDISQKKQDEQSLRDSDDLLTLFIERSPIYAYIKEVSPRESRVLFASNNFREMIGVPGQDMVGKTMYDLFPREFAEKITRDDWAVVANGVVFKEDEELNGRSFTSIKFPIAQGNRTLLAGFTIDVSERKRAEAEKLKLQGQFQQAQKMESVGRLAGGVAHDFNNMLCVIIGHAELVLERMAPTDTSREDVDTILKTAERSAALTRQLLAFARKQPASPAVLNLNSTIENTVKILRRLIGEDIALIWEPRDLLWRVRMDPTQVDQILTNLCVNARDAIAGVGTVTITTACVTIPAGGDPKHLDVATGEYVQLVVGDDGSGIAPEVLPHLFEPFFTTKPPGQGTGLGLATVYGIIKQNGGYINVSSGTGQGASFAVYLPRYCGSADSVRAHQPARETRRGRETVLLVEDEMAVLQLSMKVLENQGYRVLATNNPSEALRLAQEQPGEIHLLITDVVMPNMNGRDLAIKLADSQPEMKSLFMSGYTADVIATHGVLDQETSFLQKPFRREELITRVREVLQSRS